MHAQAWWQNPDNVDLVQFMGKDNVPFHTVIFPATLLGTRQPWTLMKSISVTEYLNYEGGKFSKSRGVGVFGNDAKETGIPVEASLLYGLWVAVHSHDCAQHHGSETQQATLASLRHPSMEVEQSSHAAGCRHGDLCSLTRVASAIVIVFRLSWSASLCQDAYTGGGVTAAGVAVLPAEQQARDLGHRLQVVGPHRQEQLGAACQPWQLHQPRPHLHRHQVRLTLNDRTALAF